MLPYWVKQWTLPPSCTKERCHRGALTLKSFDKSLRTVEFYHYVVRNFELWYGIQRQGAPCCVFSDCSPQAIRVRVFHLYAEQIMPGFHFQNGSLYLLCAWGLRTLITIFMLKSREYCSRICSLEWKKKLLRLEIQAQFLKRSHKFLMMVSLRQLCLFHIHAQDFTFVDIPLSF